MGHIDPFRPFAVITRLLCPPPPAPILNWAKSITACFVVAAEVPPRSSPRESRGPWPSCRSADARSAPCSLIVRAQNAKAGGQAPLHPPNDRITPMTQSLRIHPLSAAHAPHEGLLSFPVGGHLGPCAPRIAEEHGPREGKGRVDGRRRPVLGEHIWHIGEGVAGRQPRSACIGGIEINQSGQFLDRRKPPACSIAHLQLVAMCRSVNRCIRI